MAHRNSPNLLSEIEALALDPLPCDRWIARSCLQKAIRRGETVVARRALANLFLHDPRAVWRHLTIIALEDVGVANLGILRSIVSAKREHSIARAPGLLWSTLVGLTERLARSDHSQAVCDLLLRAENDPGAGDREVIIDAGCKHWASLLYDQASAIQHKAIAALAFAGLFDSNSRPDPDAVLEICSDTSHTSEIGELARSAWKLSRNPMALLLPIAWSGWRERAKTGTQDDPFPAGQETGEVPGYAVDQFTRTGKSAIRRLVLEDEDLRRTLATTSVPEAQWPSIGGDLVFLVEGGLCVRRTTWPEAEELRSPARWLPATAALGELICPMMDIFATKLRLLARVRQQLYPRGR